MIYENSCYSDYNETEDNGRSIIVKQRETGNRIKISTIFMNPVFIVIIFEDISYNKNHTVWGKISRHTYGGKVNLPTLDTCRITK